MNKVLLASLVTTNLLIVVVAGLYIKLVLLETPRFKIYIKWIPAFILFMQSIYLSYYYRKNNDNKSLKYCILISICFLFCIGGDICLALRQEYMFFLGMLIFMMFYIVFGSVRVVDVYKFLRNENSIEEYNVTRLCHNKKLMVLFVIIGLLVSGLGFSYLLIQIIHNDKYDHPIYFVAISIYFLAMLYASNTHLVMLFVYRDTKYYLAYVGIIVFMVSDFLVMLFDVKYNNVIMESIYMAIYWCSLIVIGASCYAKEINDFYLPW